MKSKLKLGIVVAIVALAIIGFAPRRANASYTSHAPISITADNQFTVGNGVTSGAGTSGDPYIIENWVISASSATGIHLSNTTAYVTIRNCLIENGGVTWSGIFITGASNITVIHNISDNNEEGIIMGSSSTHNTIDNNVIFGNDDAGIVANSTSYNVIQNNAVYGNVFESIAVWFSTYDNIINNICENSKTAQGMTLKNDSNLLVTGNTIRNNFHTSQGIATDTLTNSSLTGNILDNNAIGLNLANTSNNNLVENNTFSNNGNYGVYVQSGSDNNYIYLNSFLNNNVIPQVSDASSNYWDNNYRGNYWSDWQPPTHPDSDNNGVVDNWYPIWGGSFDHYPLIIGGVITGIFYPNVPDNLRVENRIRPMDLTTLTPTFSWRYSSPDNDNLRIFWIQVGTSPDFGDSINDRWDHKENRNATSGSTISVVYNDDNSAIALENDTEYYWRVAVSSDVTGNPPENAWIWSGNTLGSGIEYFEAITATTNHAPTCTITYPPTGYSTTTGTSVSFTCTASDPDNDALTYLWDFGDGATSTSTAPTHTYSSTGSRGVSLTVSDGSLTGTDRITIDITAPTGGGGGGTPPVATTPPITSSWGIPLWIILAIAAGISYWRKIRIGTYQLAFILVGVLVVLFIFAPSTANYQVITFVGTPPWGA